jgi:VIT1/CCC1 family predicted Fe2+/Mn2+ transporter
LLPLVAILLPPVSLRVPVTMAAVLLALALTGVLSAQLGGAPTGKAVARNVIGGALALAATYLIGDLVGGLVT